MWCATKYIIHTVMDIDSETKYKTNTNIYLYVDSVNMIYCDIPINGGSVLFVKCLLLFKSHLVGLAGNNGAGTWCPVCRWLPTLFYMHKQSF